MPDTCHANHRKLNAECQHPDHSKELAAKSYRRQPHTQRTYSRRSRLAASADYTKRKSATLITAQPTHTTDRQPQYTTGVKPMTIADAITAAVLTAWQIITFIGN